MCVGDAGDLDRSVDDTDVAFHKELHDKIAQWLSVRAPVRTPAASDSSDVEHPQFDGRNHDCPG